MTLPFKRKENLLVISSRPISDPQCYCAAKVFEEMPGRDFENLLHLAFLASIQFALQKDELGYMFFFYLGKVFGSMGRMMNN